MTRVHESYVTMTQHYLFIEIRCGFGENGVTYKGTK